MNTNEQINQIGKIRRKVWGVLGILVVASLSLTIGAGNAFAQRALGIDVSRWQGTIDWVKVKNDGISFAWSQATRGLTSPNDNFKPNMTNGKSAGVYMGAYHFAFPAESSPETQADYFWNLTGPYIKADGKSLMPALDMEIWNGYVGASSYTDWANKWCNRVIAHANAAGVKVKPVIYVSACDACRFGSGISQWGAWIANWNGQNPQTGSPWSSCSSCNRWGTWHFWQYTDSGTVNGISGAVDRDVYNGTVSHLAANWIATSTSTGSVIVDNNTSGFSASSSWSTGTSAADKYGSDYRYRSTQATSDPATWTGSLSSSKTYSVYAWWSQGSNRSATAPYIVYHASGSSTVQKNQQANGGKWNLLGSWSMSSGSNQVRLSCWTTTGYVVIADAVKWE